MSRVTQAGRRQRRKRAKMSEYGFKRFEAWIHHKDEDAVREYIRSLNEPRLRAIAGEQTRRIVNGA